MSTAHHRLFFGCWDDATAVLGYNDSQFFEALSPLWVNGSIAKRFPKLRLLSLHGVLERTILEHFPTITELMICDLGNHHTITSIRDAFNQTQDGSSTPMPRLRKIMVQDKFEVPIRAFCAERRLLGLTVPEVKIIATR